jgi:cathepsin L
MRTALLLVASLLVLSVCVSAFTLTEKEYQSHFSAFVKKFEKRYTHDQFFSKYNIFKANLDIINEHNAKANQSYTLGVNEFADMTLTEFHSKMTGYKHRKMSKSARAAFAPKVKPSAASLPTSWDWSAKGAVTPIKNQGQCGSCWAFSTTGSVEGITFIETGTLPDLSEQQLVDCSASYGNDGCNGGLMDYAFQYVEANGLCSEQDYPYKAVTGTCQSSSCTPQLAAGRLYSYTDVPEGDETDLGPAVYQQPVSIAIEADSSAFQFYSSGVFNDPGCGEQLDHGVLIVGYGQTTSGQQYWKVKNSWGNTWGEAGYILMIRGKNECGLAQSASYPAEHSS